MATLARVGKEAIERARQLLLKEIYSEKTDDRYIKKQAVKQLLGPVIAARESGMSFEEIAKVFAGAGLDLAPSTIKTYYFELKAEADLAKESRRHADTVARVRTVIEKRSNQMHQEHGARVALDFVEQIAPEPTLYNALGTSEPASPAKNAAIAEKSTQKPIASKKRPASPAAPSHAADAEKTLPRLPLANAAELKHASAPEVEEREKGTDAQQPPTVVVPKEIGEGAFTIDDIERMSAATEERTVVTEDLEVRNDRVYLVSGAPFVGTLKKNQIHLLRTVGRIIAVTNGKSSRDFVSMPSKI